MDDTDPWRQRIVLIAVGFEGGLAVLAWLLGWLLGEPPLAGARWDGQALLLGVAGTVPLLLAFVFLLVAPLPPLRRMRQLFDDLLIPLFRDCTVAELAAISLLAGVGEEMLFRGVLQAVVARWFGVVAGLVVASVAFGLLHAITPAYVVIASLFGLYLGWLWLLTDNLAVAIVAHALYDFLVLVYLLRIQGLPPAGDSGEGEDHEPGDLSL